MNWSNVSDFLRMGGYGFYVWTSYGVCAALIAAEIWMARGRQRRAAAQARRETVRGGA